MTDQTVPASEVKTGDKINFMLVRKKTVGIITDAQLSHKSGTVTSVEDQALWVKSGAYEYKISKEHVLKQGESIRKFL